MQQANNNTIRTFNKLAIVLFVMVAALFVLSACQSNLEKISVQYFGGELEVGQQIENGVVLVSATYSDGKTKTVSSGFELDYDTSASGKNKVVTVSYTEGGITRSTTFTVTVKEPYVAPDTDPDPILAEISAEYVGGELEIGDTLNKSDITVVASYDKGASKAVTSFDVSYDFSEAGAKLVTVSYSENGVTKTTTVTVQVNDPEPTPPDPDPTLAEISAEYVGGNVEWGGTLSLDDVVVTARYSDDSSHKVTGFTVRDFNPEESGAQQVTVVYTEGDVTRQCTISVTVLQRVVPEVADYGKYGIRQQDGSIKITNTAFVSGELQIHFLAFENVTPGDCVYIKAGDTDILIDAGSVASSSITIDNYISKYCTDGVLEYVIATHADQDHILGFVGNGTNGIMHKYRCGTIIKYSGTKKDTTVRENFEALCNKQVENNNAKLFTSWQCYSESVDGAKRVYQVSDNVQMEILYHKYYQQVSSDENNQSVCVMFHQYGEGYDFDNPSNPNNKNYVNHFLFTGDLESEGENSLVENNPNLPEVVLFKGGHHGSATSSNEILLNKIKPKLVCVCTCCDESTTYKFPRQEFINRVAKYTDMVFMTNTRNGESRDYVHLNGNIAVTSTAAGVFVNCSNNNTLFKNSTWFTQAIAGNNPIRTCPDEWKDS